MEKIENIGRYKEWIHGVKKKFGTIHTNCFLMAGAMETFVREGRIYAEAFENGLAVYTDEKYYYNLYYFWKPGAPFADFRKDKPVLIEELNNSGVRDRYLKKMEPILLDAGFALFKNNLQLANDLTQNRSAIELHCAQAVKRVEANRLVFRYCEDQGMLEQAVALWKSALDPTDIPLDHMTLRENDRLLCVLDQNHSVIATQWWRAAGKSSEGRHTVTRSDYYRQGIALALLHSWRWEAAQRGALKAYTWVSAQNTRSLALFQKAGFIHNGKTSIQYLLK